MLVYAEGSPREILAAKAPMDRGAAVKLASELFPKETIEPLPDGSLENTSLPNDELFIATFPNLTVIAAREFGIDQPSKLPQRFLEVARGRDVYLHAMHSVVDWFAFAVWRAGRLERSLSVAPDNGILEDIGEKMVFELPYWSGDHPAVDPEDEGEDAYPLPFHPLELGEAALKEFFGYQLEGFIDPSLLEPESVPLARFRRRKASLFTFWRK